MSLYFLKIKMEISKLIFKGNVVGLSYEYAKVFIKYKDMTSGNDLTTKGPFHHSEHSGSHPYYNIMN